MLSNRVGDLHTTKILSRQVRQDRQDRKENAISGRISSLAFILGGLGVLGGSIAFIARRSSEVVSGPII
jgi:hypothetical protein